MNEFDKIFKVLEEHKEHSHNFREELKVGLNTVAFQIKELSEHQKTANGRTGKLEETVNNLQKADILMTEQLKNIKDGNKKISERTWTIITSVVAVIIASLIMLIFKK